MTPVPVLSHGPELFVYTIDGSASWVTAAKLLWPVTYIVDRMQYD